MGRVLAKRALLPHPGGQKPEFSVGCKISEFGNAAFKVEYVVIGAIAGLRIPSLRLPSRADGLWKETCFEAFFAGDTRNYVEFNFAPSGAWASYRFENYREGMAPALDLGEPSIFVEKAEQRLALTAFIEFLPTELAGLKSLALSAVIEEAGGTKSYWALAHPPGEPDFHHPACFTAILPAPEKS